MTEKLPSVKFELRSRTPLLMHSPAGVNPLHPLVIEKKKLTSKRKKTEEDHLKIFEIDWLLGLYYSDDVGVFVPGANIEAMLIKMAKRSKKGTDAKIGLFCLNSHHPLIYNGPKDPDTLFKNPNFVDIRNGKIQGSAIMICRPRFNEWKLQCEIEYDPAIFNRDEVIAMMEGAGHYIGICDYRERYGKFEAVVIG